MEDIQENSTTEDNSVVELPLQSVAEHEVTVAAIIDEEEVLQLLQDLRFQLNALENTYKRNIRKVDALPLLKRCIAVIEKATGPSPHQSNLPVLPIQQFLRNAYAPSGPKPGTWVSARKDDQPPQFSAIHLKEWTLKQHKQELYQQALEKFKYDIYRSERLIHIKQNECMAGERKEELYALFNRVDLEQSKSKGKSKALGDVTNEPRIQGTSRALVLYRPRETVTRTEIVPMLPCKNYDLPHRNLFISGMSDPAPSDRQLQRAEMMERDDELVRKEIRREMIARIQGAAKLREEERENQNAEGVLKYVEDTIAAGGCVVD